MTKIEINDCVYHVHPIYDLYAADKNGNIVHIVKQKPRKGNKHHDGYMKCTVRQRGQKNQKRHLVHRFVWECYNGLIPHGKVIDHINDVRDDNRICNLQLFTPQQNNKKSAKNKDYTSTVKNFENPKYVKVVNCDTKEIIYFNSMKATSKHLAINHGIVKMVCDGNKYNKTGTSKKDGCKYKFEYVNKDKIPDNYIVKASSDLRKNLYVDDTKLRKLESEKKMAE